MALPLTAQEVDVLRRFFAADWADGISITSSYQTAVEEMADGSEVRRMLTDKPLRSFRRVIMSTGQEDVGLLRAFSSLVTYSRFPMPLETESMYVSGAVASGATEIPVMSSLYRRIGVGTTVLIAAFGGCAEQQPYHTATLNGVTPTTVTLSDPVSFALRQGSLIVPVAICEPTDTAEAGVVTQTVIDLPIEAFEYRGPDGGLPASDDPGFPLHTDGLRILDIEPNDEIGSHSVSHSVVSDKATVGLALPQFNYGRRSRVEQEVAYRFLTRESAWRMIQFFDAVKGKGRRFWAPVPTNDLTYESGSVRAPWSVEEWPLHPNVMVKNRAGDVRVSENVTPTADGLGSVAGVSSPGGEVIWAKPCFRARLASDEMTELWTTDEVMDTRLSFLEIIDPEVGAGVTVDNPRGSGTASSTPGGGGDGGGGTSPPPPPPPPPPGDNLRPPPGCDDCEYQPNEQKSFRSESSSSGRVVEYTEGTLSNGSSGGGVFRGTCVRYFVFPDGSTNSGSNVQITRTHGCCPDGSHSWTESGSQTCDGSNNGSYNDGFYSGSSSYSGSCSGYTFDSSYQSLSDPGDNSSTTETLN